MAENNHRLLHPYEKAGLLSKAFFSWMLPVLWRGFKERVDISDIPTTIPNREETYHTGNSLEKLWDRELQKGPDKGRPKLFSALLRNHAKNIVVTSVMSTFCDCFIKTWQAVSLGQMIYYSSQLLFGNEDHKPSNAEAVTVINSTDTTAIPPQSNITSAIATINSTTTSSLFGQPGQQIDTHHLNTNGWSIHEPLVQWTLSLMIATLLFPVLIHTYCFEMMRLGIQIRVATSYLIYKKAVKLSHAALAQSTIGQMVNLLSNDVDRFDIVVIFIPFMWIAPIQVLLTMAILWSIVGSTSLTLLVILFIFMCIQAYLSQKFSYYRNTIANLTDVRSRYINEVITAIRVVKTYAWEKHWYDKITKARDNEMQAIKDVSFYRAINQAVSFFSSKIIVFGVLATTAITSNVDKGVMNPWNVFLIISLLNNVQSTISRLLPQTISFWSEMMVSIKRIEEFLLLEERVLSKSLEFKSLTEEQKINLAEIKHQIDEAMKNEEQDLGACRTSRILAAKKIMEQLDQQHIEQLETNTEQTIRIRCDHVNASWTEMETTPSLIDLSFDLRQNELLIVCGSVASGKSSLLLALLGECPLFNGTIKVWGKLGYASQQSWIFSGTVRDNILFGEPFEAKRYSRVVTVCALRRDLQLLENGDLTWISDKGTSLSGGQKARINLARSLYRDSDVYLLDDPLSAVDPNVSEHIFFHAIKDFLKYKSVILVTHHVEYLKHADNILLLNHGRALAYGNFRDIRKHGIDFLELSQALIHDKSPIGGGVKTVHDTPITNNDVTDEGASNNISNNLNMNGTILLQKPARKTDSTVPERLVDAEHAAAKNSITNITIEQQMDQKDRMEVEKLVESNLNDEKVSSFKEILPSSLPIIIGTLDQVAKAVNKGKQKQQQSQQQKPISTSTILPLSPVVNFSGAPMATVPKVSSLPSTPLSTLTKAVSTGSQPIKSHTRLSSPQKPSPRSSFKKSPKEIKEELRESNRMRTEAITEYLALPVVGITNGPTSRSMSLTGGINSGERLHTGSVKLKVWLKYLTAGSKILSVLTVIGFLMSQIFYTSIDGYLSVWTNIEQQRMTNNFTDANVNPNYRGLYHMVLPLTRSEHIITYMSLIIILTVFSLLKNLAFFGAANRSAEYLHAKLLKGAIYAHMSYFDKNSIGVILNRATRDMGVIDEILPVALFTAVEILLQLLATLCLISSVDYYLAIPSLLLLAIILCFHRFFVGASRDLKRLENIARSPIFSHLASTLEGLATIRACKHEGAVEEQYISYQNEHTSIFFYYIGARRWLAITLDSLNALYIAGLCMWCMNYIADGSAIGLMISSAILMCGLMQFGFFKLAETEAFMTSVERVIECIDLKQEENYDQDNDFGIMAEDDDEQSEDDNNILDIMKDENNNGNSKSEFAKNLTRSSPSSLGYKDSHLSIANQASDAAKFNANLMERQHPEKNGTAKNASNTLKQFKKNLLSKQCKNGVNNKRLRWITNIENKKVKLSEWPQSGNLQFNNVTLAYNHDEKPVLHNLTFSIQSGERVGIVGRTGAGKTSIITTLFRLYNYTGQIIIDLVDTKKLALKRLREKLSIIPQDPIIFTGSFRNNVDPFDLYTDEQIWKALEQVHLKETVSRMPQGLASHLSEGGNNLSAGQKQLVCLARTLLKNNKILILDEATANVDHETDTLVQDAMRTQFVGCTVLTIAHRLNTIIDYDKVLVMEGGRVIEYAEPYILLQKNNGIFAQMIAITGKRSAAHLKSLAKAAYESRHGNMMTDETLSTNEGIRSLSYELSPVSDQTVVANKTNDCQFKAATSVKKKELTNIVEKGGIETPRNNNFSNDTIQSLNTTGTDATPRSVDGVQSEIPTVRANSDGY